MLVFELSKKKGECDDFSYREVIIFGLYVIKSGTLDYWLGVRNHNVEVVSSNPARVTIKTPLARNATGNHLTKSTSLEKHQRTSSGFFYT